MRSQYSRGAIAKIYLDIITANVGISGSAPVVAIQRVSDEKWFDASDSLWKSTIVDNAMGELNAAMMPGRYVFPFDQNLDLLAGSFNYIAKKSCADPVRVEYDDLVFGPASGAQVPGLCEVQGTIFSAQGIPAQCELVRATLQPVFTDASARGVISDRVIMVTTNANGDFSLLLVRGGIFRLEIPGIGYDRKVTIPNLSAVLFTAL